MTFFIPTGNELLSIKELAGALKRSRGYIHAMKRAGFPMPGNRATVNHALRWLAENPSFRHRKNKSEPLRTFAG